MVGAMPWASARAVAAQAARPPAPAWQPLSEALGCRLAAPLRALVAVPGVDVSAMDGYAVAGPGPWRIAGRVPAGGAPYGAAPAPGEAVEVATGAPVPEGAESVLPYELADADGVWVAGDPEPGKHIRRRGEDVAEGAVVLSPGTVVTPVTLGLAAALGHDELLVRPRPKVAVVVTGDEVVDRGIPGPGRVRDAIGPFLPGLVAWAGGRVTATTRLADGPEALLAALDGEADARAPRAAERGRGGARGSVHGRLVDPVSEAGVVVVCGASSRGPADHLRAVVAEIGAEVLVDGVAVRPGHPQLLARLPGGPLLVGLPGNPFAALSASLTLLVPILRALSGGATAHGTSALAGVVRPHPHDTRLVPVRRSGRGAVPVGHDRPGSLWGAALADALAVLPPGWSGGQVELIELPQGAGQSVQ
ncbi:molybdopterin molybdotransferase MoeA [Nonomuraea maritima]|uniref:molybdopterin molybdotransferase MoeA n=1 Tax=Nonomuraea maritima TaxID=683260 RepID=UPI00371D6A3A